MKTTMTHQINGIHHITAIAADPQRNVDFYTDVLGLRLVKQTVNFDDPGTYHLYYGDDLGRPGTILTFFPFPGVPRGRRGPGQVAAIAFAVGAGSLGYWADHLKRHGVTVGAPAARLDEEVLSFADPDGLALELVARAGADGPEQVITGFHGATLWVRDHEPTARLLADALGFRLVAQEGRRVRYAAGPDEPGRWVDLVSVPDAPEGVGAAGTVHHIAWRTPDDAQQLAWRHALARHGLHVTPVRDRQYFRSIYFREPGGVLFEIATDPPGFAVDEAPEHLGTQLKLPPWLEPYRRELAQVLPPLRLPEVVGRR
jgi:glyoxalase family protein